MGRLETTNTIQLGNIAKEVSRAFVETGFDSIMMAAGFPLLAVSKPLIKGLLLGLFENCFNDCSQRTLSIRETKKLNHVTIVALQTFRELAEKDNINAWELNIEPARIEYAFEVAEHITLDAIRQSEKQKVDILGRYYGKSFYMGERCWQDMHQLINMISSLTLRQIVLIRLIVEGFSGCDTNCYIKNPSACIEVNQLKDYGIWRTEDMLLSSDDSFEIQLNMIQPTYYAQSIYESLMLEKFSEEDIERVIDSLELSSEGGLPWTMSIDNESISGVIL